MDIEIGILKVLISNKKLALEFANECSADIFTHSPNYSFFAKKLVEYIKLYKDLPTQKSFFKKYKINQGDKKYDVILSLWQSIENYEYSEKDYKVDLEELKSKYYNYLISSFKDNFSDLDNDNFIQETKKLQIKVSSINTHKKFDQKTLKSAIPDFKAQYNAKKENPDFGKGIYTGYSFIDHVTNGLRPSEMLLVGAESGGGKSMFLMNVAIQMWLQQNIIESFKFTKGYNVLYFSLEMPYQDCLERVMARISMTPQKHIRDAKLEANDLTKMAEAVKFIERYPYEFEIVDIPRGATSESIELIFNEVKTRYTPDIVVVDYLGLMDYEEQNIDDWLKLGKISEKLHEFGRVHNVVMLSAVQLTDIKRSGKGAEFNVGMHRIGRSSIIMHNANFGLQIEKRPNEENFPDAMIHFIKSRRTELTKGRVIKDFSRCALLDVSNNESSLSSDDLSKKIEALISK